jgi:trimethylamine--corrinoid protein Co-methyltransferase
MTAPISDLKAGAMNPRTQDREIDDRVVTRPVMRVWQASETADVAEATLDVLRICGVEVRHPKALALLAAAGAQVEGTRVRFPAELVKSALDTAPAHVTVRARGSALPLELGRGLSYFGTGPDCLYVTPSAEESRRRAVVADVLAMAELCQRLPHIDFVMSMGLPEDTPTETADLVQFAAMLTGTEKPLVISSPRGGAPLRVMRQMAEMSGDVGSFACLVMSSPPLQIDGETAEKLMVCAELDIPVILAPAPAAGTTAPATIPATVLVGNAEVMAGLVVNQLARRGAPFVYGVGAGVMDMRTTVDAYCRPEHFLGNHAACDLGRAYGLPTWSYAGVSDSKIFDGQWALEAAITTLLGGLSRADLLHDVGYMESGMQSSFETIVLGNELVGYVKRLYAGVPTDDEALALEEIRAVGPGGNHLARRYTRDHRRDFWVSDLFDHSVHDRWEAGGSSTLRMRVGQRTRELLETPREFELPVGVPALLMSLALLDTAR